MEILYKFLDKNALIVAFVTVGGIMYLGELIEFGETEAIFMKPKRQETEDYITGRFG